MGPMVKCDSGQFVGDHLQGMVRLSPDARDALLIFHSMCMHDNIDVAVTAAACIASTTN